MSSSSPATQHSSPADRNTPDPETPNVQSVRENAPQQVTPAAPSQSAGQPNRGNGRYLLAVAGIGVAAGIALALMYLKDKAAPVRTPVLQVQPGNKSPETAKTAGTPEEA